MPIRCFPDGRSIQVDDWPPSPPVPAGHIALRDFAGTVRVVSFGRCHFAALPLAAVREGHWLRGHLPAPTEAFGPPFDAALILGVADIATMDGKQHLPRTSYPLAEALELTREVGDAWRAREADLAEELAAKQAAIRKPADAAASRARWAGWLPSSLRQ